MWTLALGFALTLAVAERPAHAGVADPIAFKRARYAEYLSGNVRVLALDTYASERLCALLYALTRRPAARRWTALDFWVGETGDWALAGLGVALEPARRADI